MRLTYADKMILGIHYDFTISGVLLIFFIFGIL
jgi:hypothetical protein